MQTIQRKLSVLFLGGGVLLAIAYSLASGPILELLADLVSADGHITQNGAKEAAISVYFLAVVSGVVGIVLWLIKDKSGWEKLWKIITTEPGSTIHAWFASPYTILTSTTVLGAFLLVHINLYTPESPAFAILYLENGVFETLTAIMMATAAICLVIAVWRLRDRNHPVYTPRWSLVLLASLAFALAVYAGEEISWGQHFFSWSTPDWFPEGNVQDETNLHNFFNDGFHLVYSSFVLFPLPLLFRIWLEYTHRLTRSGNLLLPHPSLIVLSIMIALVSAVRPQEQELLEEMIALFTLAYAARVFAISKASEVDALCVPVTVSSITQAKN